MAILVPMFTFTVTDLFLVKILKFRGEKLKKMSK